MPFKLKKQPLEIKELKINLAAAYDRLRSGGKLKHYEVHDLKTSLKTPTQDDNLYMVAMVFTLGVKAYRENVRLINRYLNRNTDSYDLSGFILGACNHWHHTMRHKEFLLSICHPKTYIKHYEAANAAFEVFEHNIHKPHFYDVFETLFWRWQETLNPKDDEPYNAGYTRGLNRIMEVALIGDQAFEPFHSRPGQFPNPEWELPLEEKMKEMKLRNEQGKKKFSLFKRLLRTEE